MTTPTETAIPAATITGTDGQTYTLELRPQINPDRGLRYGIFNAETGDDTEASGSYFGGDTWSDEDGELHLTEEHYDAARESALHAMSIAWSAPEWNLTSLE